MPNSNSHNHNSKLRQILPYHQTQNNNIGAPPLKIPRLSPAASVEGVMIWNPAAAVMAHDEQSTLPSVGLGLGLTTGGGGGDDDRINNLHPHHQQQRREKTSEEEAAGKSVMMVRDGFTMSQLQELQLQSVIYKYIEAGSGVPPSLLVPIWRSLAAAATAVPLHHPTLHHLFPNLTQCNSAQMMGMEQYYMNGKKVDPEPGRCRRTDGKKWRCSKEALPDQKYCDKHMHRGRHRSRNAKHVVLQPPPPPSSAGGGGRSGGGCQSSGSSSSAGSCNISKSRYHHCI